MLYLLAFFGIILLIVFIKYLYVRHYQKNKLTHDVKYRFANTSSDKEIYDCPDCRCTDHYIYTKAGIKRIIAYEDILWVYIFKQQLLTSRTFGLTMLVYTVDGKNYKIMNSSGTGKKIMRSFNTVLDIIKEKNPDVLVGETEENKQKYYSQLN